MRLVLLGPPGAGKGTLSEYLVEKYDCAHISTGDIFREHRQKQTDFGKLLASYMDKGLFVPDEIVLEIIGDYLKNKVGKRSFIFDGFPRSVAQAEALEKLLAEMEINLDGVVNLEVDTDLLVNRLVQRRVCPQCKCVYHLTNRPPVKEGICDHDGAALEHRADDREEVIKERMNQYVTNTAPLIDFYTKRQLLLSFDGSGKPVEVREAVFKKLSKLND